jgi:NADH-quinone oxidoreductase subunit L
MLKHVWIIPAITFASFWVILLFGKHLPRKGSEVGVAALTICFVLSCIVLTQWVHHKSDVGKEFVPVTAERAWFDFGAEIHQDCGKADSVYCVELSTYVEQAVFNSGEDISDPAAGRLLTGVDYKSAGSGVVDVKTLVDGLTVSLLLVVSIISLCVHIFSTNYMSDDKRYTHYFAALSLFTSGMFILVTAGTTLQILLGWEIMGLCSFMLIGHWWEEKKNSDAALKAFLTTRTGDIGLLVGLGILFFAARNTFDIPTINTLAAGGGITHTLLLAAGIFLFMAVIGKSAQFPLHTWLPDAMAGPTPVSALIHAATMVVAGVFLLARFYPVFFNGFSIGHGGVNAIALIGGITVIIAALLAFVQDDIKKVLAYSTISQLGYMVMALGCGAWVAAVFHLFTHAFFKALLFLGAGSVSHSVHSFDMKKDMGGLRKYMPTTYRTFLIGTLALAGFFPLAGFWSKDEILATANHNGYAFFMVVGIIGAFMTVAYMARCVYLTFHGEFRGHGHPHESPRAITWPLIALAFLSITSGFLNATAFHVEKFAEWFEPRITGGLLPHVEFNYTIAVISTVVVVVGGYLSWVYQRRYALNPAGITERNALARAGYKLLINKYYLDYLYTDVIIAGIKGPIARGAYWFNQNVIDGVVNGAARVSRRAGNFTYNVIDQKGIDTVINDSGVATEESGEVLRAVQSGRLQQYAAMLFGATAFIGLVIVLLR